MDDRTLRAAGLSEDPFAPSDELDPAELAGWVEEWRAREEALRRHAPPRLQEVARAQPGPSLPPGLHGELEAWLPRDPLREAVHALLRGWYRSLLANLGASLESGELARARSWVDARRRLPSLAAVGWPSELLAGLADPARARVLLGELFAPPGFGVELGRYAQRLDAVALALGPRAQVRAWDVGTASGEGAWELAAALGRGGAQVELLGTEPCPLQLLMAESRLRPHDPARSEALAEFLTRHPQLEDPARCRVRFQSHALGQDQVPPGPWDAITCHGLLGESLRGPAVTAAFQALAGALAPGGVLSLADTFRADRQAEAREAILAADPAALGLRELEPGLWQAS